MFCSKCGQELGNDVKFCSGCGASVGDNQKNIKKVVQEPVSGITARSFLCSGCGESLKIPKNARGVVKCPSCKTECILDGIIKNAEIAAKENINSGIPLTATSAILHKQLIECFLNQPYFPLDIFENAEVIREERYCVPAYCFDCNGEASYSYEEGEYDESKNYSTEDFLKGFKWYTKSGSERVSAALFSSGNKKMTSYINELYQKTDLKKLIDFEYLEFPQNVETLDYDLPQLVAYNEHIKQIVEEMLIIKGQESLKHKKELKYNGELWERIFILRNIQQNNAIYIKNFMMGDSKIKKEIIRVFLGLYRVVYKYRDQEFSIWFSGDGQKSYFDEIPVDQKLKETLREKYYLQDHVKRSDPPKILTIGFWVLIIISIFSLIATIFGGGKTFGVPLIICAIGCMLCRTMEEEYKKKHEKKHEKGEAKFQNEIDDILSQVKNVAQKFIEKEQALRGIYHEVTGKTDAFNIDFNIKDYAEAAYSDYEENQ